MRGGVCGLRAETLADMDTSPGPVLSWTAMIKMTTRNKEIRSPQTEQIYIRRNWYELALIFNFKMRNLGAVHFWNCPAMNQGVWAIWLRAVERMMLVNLSNWKRERVENL